MKTPREDVGGAPAPRGSGAQRGSRRPTHSGLRPLLGTPKLKSA